MKRAAFIDKDGTMLKNIPYNTDLSLVSFLPGAMAGMRLLQDMGFSIIVITNQPGIEKGLCTSQGIRRLAAYLRAELRRCRIRLSGFYFCPHDPGRGKSRCSCRKPQSGLLLVAARELDISLHDSWMMGDILDDVEAGHRAGCHSILVLNGNETEWRKGPGRNPDYTCGNLLEAARYVGHCNGKGSYD